LYPITRVGVRRGTTPASDATDAPPGRRRPGRRRRSRFRRLVLLACDSRPARPRL